MEIINYRIHTSADPLDGEHAFLLTRKRRPAGRDYEVYANRLMEEYRTPVHAIYEGSFWPSVEDQPKFESDAHEAARRVLIAENIRIRELRRPLYRLGSLIEAIHDAMEWYLQTQERNVRDMKADLAHIEAAEVLAIDVPDLSHIAASFMSHADMRGAHNLDTITRRTAELGYQLAMCDELARSLAADRRAKGEPDCCENPFYAVKPDKERTYNEAKLICANCQTELVAPERVALPDIRPSEVVAA